MRVAKHSFFNQAILGLYLPLAGGVMDAGAIIDMSGGDIIDIDNITFADGNLNMEATATNRILLPNNNDPANPTLAFDGGTMGFIMRAPTRMEVVSGGQRRFEWSGIEYKGSLGGSASMINEAASATNPVHAFNGDIDTGWGSGGADMMDGIAGGVNICRLTEAANRAEFRTLGSIVRKVTDVNATPYTVLQTDYYLQCRRTAAGVLTVNLPAIGTVGDGFVLIIKDTGYNASGFNITVVRNGADTIDNVGGNYTINADGTAVVLIANDTTDDWEIF